MSDSARSNVVLEIGSKIRAGVSVTYGDPVELDGVQLVPVAAACYGFGEGSDGDANGGGGGSMSVPLGAYVTRDGGVRFEPNTTVLAVLAVPVVAVVGCVVAKAIKACRR